MRRRTLGYTGHLFEEEVLGRCRISWDGKEYFPYSRSMRMVKENQPWDPASPEPSLAHIIHRRVALALKVDDWNELRLYTAVGSPLDIFHGVDAFFEWRGQVVTIDVTTNPRKDVHKADIIFHEGDNLDAFVHQVVDEFAVKRWRRNHVR